LLIFIISCLSCKMLKGVVAFVAVIGTVFGGNFNYNGESWKKEIDLVDYGKMELKKTFDDWRQSFGKKYETVEEEYHRFAIFIEKLAKDRNVEYKQ